MLSCRELFYSLFTILLLFTAVSQTADLYISNFGADNSNCGSYLTPCATFGYVFDEDSPFNLENTVVHVQSGFYEIADVWIEHNNVTLLANGTVYFTIHKYAFTINSNAFKMDGFRFSYSTSTHISYFLLNLEKYGKDSSVNSNFLIQNCVFENINFLGLVKADFASENNGTIQFYNNYIHNSNSEFIFETSNIRIDIQNTTIDHYVTEGIAIKLDQTFQSFSLRNVTITNSQAYDLFYIDFSESSSLSFYDLTIQNSIFTNNVLYLYSRSNITRMIFENIHIDNSQNIYFIATAKYISNCTIDNLKITNSRNPTSATRYDAVFELPNGHYILENIDFINNTDIYGIFDVREDKYYSYYNVTNINIQYNTFNSYVYYYNTKIPAGGVIHLSYIDIGEIDHLVATNNTGVVQIIGITEANDILITNCSFSGNRLSNDFAHDISIMGIPSNKTYGEATIEFSTFYDSPPVVSCYDSEHNFILMMNNNTFAHNATHPYTDAINTKVYGVCSISCDSGESICGYDSSGNMWIVWLIVGLIVIIVIAAVGAYFYMRNKRSQYETIE